MPTSTVLDVMLILERNGLILLAERANTGSHDGRLNLPSGKVEPGEDIVTAVIRETREEIGLILDPAHLRLVHAMQFHYPGGNTRVGWFFHTDHWDGDPVNAEPHKCAGLQWHDPHNLPEHTVPYNAFGVAHHLNGEPFSVHGWETDPAAPNYPTSTGARTSEI